MQQRFSASHHFTAAGQPIAAPTSPAQGPVTAEQVRAEHELGMATLTPLQRAAIARRDRARNQICFGGETEARRLEALFIQDARDRSAKAEAAQ